MPAAPDFWIVRLDGAYAVRSAAGIELEGIPCIGEAESHILDLKHAAQDDDAALDDFEAQRLAEAA